MITCEVCARPLHPRAKGTLCSRCIEDGAAFARTWMVALAGEGLTPTEIATVVDFKPEVVRARLSEMRAAA